MKMPEPTMPPMTIMVASKVLRLRGGVVVAKGARIYQKSIVHSRKLKGMRYAQNFASLAFVFDSMG